MWGQRKMTYNVRLPLSLSLSQTLLRNVKRFNYIGQCLEVTLTGQKCWGEAVYEMYHCQITACPSLSLPSITQIIEGICLFLSIITLACLPKKKNHPSFIINALVHVCVGHILSMVFCTLYRIGPQRNSHNPIKQMGPNCHTT